MLELSRGLPAHTLRALAELEARTIAADGGRLKLEWGVLRTRAEHDVQDVLWWDGDRLLGFLGLYVFGASTVELAGMVDPTARRRGIATALLDAALGVCRERDAQKVLLVTPRESLAGKCLALNRNAVLEHSEYGLALRGAPVEGLSDSALSLRTATPADAPEISTLLTDAFGWPDTDTLERLASDNARTLVAEIDGRMIGTVRVTRGEEPGGVYGFAVQRAWRGRGIGRDVLRRVCHQLRDEGVRRIGLEVAVENDGALGLYTSLGFEPISTEDYYALPVA